MLTHAASELLVVARAAVGEAVVEVGVAEATRVAVAVAVAVATVIVTKR